MASGTRAAAGWRRAKGLASSVAATSTSRLRRPTSGLPYLAEITSPCSVSRIWPCTAPPGLGEDGLVAGAAAAHRAAAPVGTGAQPHAVAGKTSTNAISAL